MEGGTNLDAIMNAHQNQNTASSSSGAGQQRAGQPVYDTNHGGHYGIYPITWIAYMD